MKAQTQTQNSAETFEGFAIVEEWRPVPGYEGIYYVSNLGKVGREGHFLKPQNATTGGYLSVQLWLNGKPKMHLIHRLVAAAFIGPCPDDSEVNHRNGNKRCNAASNLEYVTRSENNRHAYQTGLRQVTERQRHTLGNSRRKPRSIVACACGCGMELETPAPYGRDRRFVNGHNMNAPMKGRLSNV